jgi:predicted TIM-barrel fold metal-dependent hydrolase
MSNFELFVNHAHLMPEYSRPDATPDAFARLCDDIGIGGAVCFAPFSTQMRSGNDDRNQNQWLADELKSRPNWRGFGTLDPQKPARDQVHEIAGLGFRGIKLHAPFQKFAFDSDWAMEAFETMCEHHLIADFHLGVHWHRLRDYDPMLIDEIAFRFPELEMILEHVGGWHYYRQVLAVITNNKYRGDHIYAGIASVLSHDVQKHWYLGPEGLNDCRWQLDGDHLIYGLDFPYNQQAAIRSDLEQIASLDWPDEDKQKLLGGNLQQLLKKTAT